MGLPMAACVSLFPPDATSDIAASLPLMNSWDQKLAPFRLDAANRWRTLAIVGWVVLCVVIVAMFIAKPQKVTGFAPYLRGADQWLEGKDMYSYKPNKGFVYSPLAAVFFSAFTFVHPAVANVAWRLLSVATLLGGVWSAIRFGPFDRIPAQLRGLVYLLLLPLSLSNIDSGQANPIVIGLILGGMAAACRERWTLCAILIACAVHWKIYPLVAGMLLLVVSPVRFGWRFILALALMAAAPFLFQSSGYVIEQYQEWIKTRTADNRLAYKIEIAPLDLWLLLVRVMHLPISELAYNGLRAVTGAGIAAFCLMGRLRAWPNERLYGGMFAFVCAWMVLLGPASEWLTYLLLAPAAAFAVVDVLSNPTRPWVRWMAFAAYGFLLLAVLRVGFLPKVQWPWLLAIQPVGGLFFAAYAIGRYGLERGRG